MSIAAAAPRPCCSANTYAGQPRMRCTSCESDWTIHCIEAAARGERGAQHALAARIAPCIRASVARYTRRRGSGTRGDACDLAQEVWIALLRNGMRKLRQWDPRRGASLEHFVSLIARRELSTLLRLPPPRVDALDGALLDELGRSSGAHTPERLVDSRRELHRLAQRLRHELPARGVAVFEGLYLDQLAPEQVAEQLKVQRQVVYNWRHRIRKLIASMR